MTFFNKNDNLLFLINFIRKEKYSVWETTSQSFTTIGYVNIRSGPIQQNLFATCPAFIWLILTKSPNVYTEYFFCYTIPTVHFQRTSVTCKLGLRIYVLLITFVKFHQYPFLFLKELDWCYKLFNKNIIMCKCKCFSKDHIC